MSVVARNRSMSATTTLTSIHLVPDWRPVPDMALDADVVSPLLLLRAEMASLSPRPMWAQMALSGRGKSDADILSPFIGTMQYGQDTVFCDGEYETEYYGLQTKMMICADGHGRGGNDASRYVVERFVRDFRRPGFMHRLRVGLDTGRMPFDMIHRFFERVDKEYRCAGGSTCSVVLVLTYKDRTYLLTCNVGDSPIWLADEGRLFPLYDDHAWDSAHEYRDYMTRCERMGLVPREVVMGRFNCGGGMIARDDGTYRPFRLYKDGTVDLNEAELDEFETKKTIVENMGGLQSVRRKMDYRILPDGDVEMRPNRATRHENWGCTPLIPPAEAILYHNALTMTGMGGLQMTRSFGDRAHKASCHVHVTPSIHFIELRKPVVVIVCSDGVDDALWRHQLASMAVKDVSAESQAQAILKEACHHGSNRLLRSSLLHDDCSLVVAHIN